MSHLLRLWVENHTLKRYSRAEAFEAPYLLDGHRQKIGITVTDDPRLKELARRFDLELIVLFGSRARGDFRPDSDYDIAVRGPRTLTPERCLDLSHALDKLYPECEVVDLRRASPLLHACIAQDGKVLFESAPGTFDQFRVFARNQYIDMKPFFEQQRALRRKELERL